jgi:hypothetical protein
MLVNVLGQGSTCYAAEVDPDIESVWPRRCLHGDDGVARHGRHLGGFGVGEILQIADVPVRDHHQMPRVVRMQVEHGVHVPTA